MTDEKNAAPISAKDFVSAYVETHKTGGTIADLASRLERSVDQVRAKKNSLSAQMKERGIKLPLSHEWPATVPLTMKLLPSWGTI